MIPEGLFIRKQIGLTQDDEFYYEEIYNNNEFYTMLEAAVDYSGQYNRT